MENKTPVSPEDIKRVKAQGFLHNRGTRCFSGRIITQNGVITAEQMKIIGEAAEKYASGKASFTVRMTLEIPGIPYENIEPFQAYIAKAGLITGGTGAKVRPIVACKGTTCVFGLYDTQAMAKELHSRFFEGYGSVALPHKFKITAGGCPNNCAKPDLNDVGIVGQRLPCFDLDACRGCGKCAIAVVCPMKALTVVEGKVVRDETLCTGCGRCYQRCPFHVADTAIEGYKIYLGGRWGKRIRIGSPLSQIFKTKEEALDMVEKALLLFKKEGKAGERFGEVLDRIGLARAEESLFSNQLTQEDSIK